MESWINEGVERDFDDRLELIFFDADKGEEILIAGGYEFYRSQSGKVDGKEIKWIERVLLIKSPVHASPPSKGLEKRIDTLNKKIKALT